MKQPHERVIVTAALPYANGSLHLGHLVEYCQADMYVRALKRMGTKAVYICADDAHGTPIEMNAGRLGVTPEQLVTRFHVEHQEHFAKFDVAFDHFSITHSDTNRAIVERVYAALRDRGQLAERSIDGNWCEHDKRFLPDRFIRGTCPKCSAKDQYGDVCEVCGATYAATEVKEPRCALCGTAPVVKQSTHLFFRLSDPENVAFLRQWVDSGTLQTDVANYVRHWIETGLMDWCISRDGPYFGFAIPDRPGKFFYVWLDAPLGYIASSVEWGEKHGLSFAELWQTERTRIEHIIGKDIVYFHTLFWPAVLRSVGYTLPSKVHVHGMLTIDGEKMSKSRGTFINASVFARHIEPQALRYYYACRSASSSDDLDLSFDDFVKRVNGELVNKHANLFSRVVQFLAQKLDGKLGELPFSAQDAQAAPVGDGSLVDSARGVVQSCRRIEGLYRNREFGAAMRELALVADIANEFMQSQKPWDQLRTDKELARQTCTFAANVCYALAMYLWPIVPRFAEAGARVLDVRIDTMDAGLLFRERNRAIGTMERLFDRIEREAVEAVVTESKTQMMAGAVGSAAAGDTANKTEAPAGKPLVCYDDFAKIELKVGRVIAAERVKKSNKLLKLQVELGEATPRQIVAGIGLVYEPERLVGQSVVVVANLQPAKLMGVESQGMLLAGGEGEGLSLVRPERELSPGAGVK